MVKKLMILLVMMTTWHYCVCPPVSKNKQEEEKEQDRDTDGLELMMHYHRYLKEVVGALESDSDFKKKLEAADEADIRSGKIAHELEFVSHHVRTRLDEIKRRELDRLRMLVKQQQQLTDNEVIDDPTHGHLDHANPHTFEIEDLKKLIAKTTEDLAEADRKRREEFKQYELQKEFEKQDKLNHTNGDEREKLEKQLHDLEEKHKKHQPLHEPGHKAQLEEVWEEQDHMQQEFDPKIFFMMHDLDSNGLWDQDEVKALFVKELDKMYAQGAPEDDMRERVEEMERMRETVFQEVDTNRDGFIDFHEFLAQTKKQTFKEDNGWKGIDEQKPYTDEELEAYIRQQQMMHPPPGYHAPPPPGHYPPPGAYHHNQVPPGGYQQGYHPNQVPPAYHQQPHHAQAQFQQQQHQQQFQQQQFQQHQPQFQHPAQGVNPQLNTNEVYPNQPHPAQPQQQHQQQQNYQPNTAQINPGQPVPQQDQPVPQQGQPVPQGQPNLQPLSGGQQQPQQGQAQPNYQPNQGQPQPNQAQQQQQQPPNHQVNQGQPNQAQPNQVPPPQAPQTNQVNNNQGQPQVQSV